MKSVARLLRLLVFACLLPSSGVHANFSNLFIFGDSLSDAGNNAVIFGANVTPVPIPGNSFHSHLPVCIGALHKRTGLGSKLRIRPRS